ncbi:MAG: hypothetical protein ABI408_06540 [Gemmatimonadaceae bacterium]
MTTPTSPAFVSTESAGLLPRDKFRTILAIAIVLLTIGGWIYVLVVPVTRFALSAQTRLWWVQQVVFVAVATACFGLLLRKRSILVPAFWLTFYALLFVVIRWVFQFRSGEAIVPGFVILYALLLWRLRLARRGMAVEEPILAG